MKNIIKYSLLLGSLFLISSKLIAAPIFTPDSQPTGWLSSPVVSLFDLSSGTENFYQIDFRKDTWSGNILAKDINNIARIQTSGPWDNFNPTIATAASLLNSTNYNSGRKIATLGHAFRWANLTAAEKTSLGSEAILNYIRGDRANEEPLLLSLRPRESVLGDILHSTINYWDHGGTNQSLYIGANDGMLHAFNANTGIENWAYIPSILLPKLAKLTEKPYVHTHFVDGPISIANMTISSTTKTILVGSLGAGGKGVFALDISQPTASSEANVAAKVLWEVSATGSFSNLGYTYGTPLLTRLSNGTAAVIVANGYVNSGNGHAVLYIINANTGALINALDTGSGSVASPNGLSSPTLYDTNGDGRPEYAYAGDIDGNLWKFDLTNNTSSLVYTTSPAQAITSAPTVRPHPSGGQLIVFATGRILTSGDKSDNAVHYVYGIWDGAPSVNSQLLTQTLIGSTFGTNKVRTISNNTINWTSGSANHHGWKVALPAGERVVGEKPFYNNGRIYFLSTNPTIDNGENWLHEFVFINGGSPLGPIFDLNKDGAFNTSDLAANGKVPVGKFLGNGVFSQPRLVNAVGLSTTLYAYHPDLPVISGTPTMPDDPGVSGGHFDFDVYYYDPGLVTASTPSGDPETKTICAKKRDVENAYNSVATSICNSTNGFSLGYDFLSRFTVGAKECEGDRKKNYLDVSCNTYSSQTRLSYANQKHEHEYDDKYDVTGVNMLNASLIDFNLPNAITDSNTQFKVLVMNQVLNPATKISVGGSDYENVKSYGNLASESNASTLINGLSSYSRNDINTLIFNLPLDAFKAKDWWNTGSMLRVGLIPTQTGCVNKVNPDGSMLNDTGRDKGISGPNGERFNGALTLQLIKASTPASALELNGPDVTYGWRVKQADFSTYVLAEYTSFWHHPNGQCYGDVDWVKDPPEDFVSDATSRTPAAGSADPKDGIFSAGLAITSVTVDTSVTATSTITTITTIYSDSSLYIKKETVDDDGTTTIYQKFRDGTEETVIVSSGDGGSANFIDPNSGSPEEDRASGSVGRQSWRELIQ